MTMMLSTRRVLLGAQTKWQTPDLAGATMTPGMAKRLPPAGPFAAAPIIQGKWDGTGTPDSVTYPRGNQIGNLTGFCYANFDPYQGSISFWITPEWAGNDNKGHYIFRNGYISLDKTNGNNLRFTVGGQSLFTVSTVAWTAGTLYHLVFRWSAIRTIDGTDYVCVSVNNAHTYGITTVPTPAAPGTGYLGTDLGGSPQVDALIQGLVISRRVWTDSNGYGDSVGNGADEIGQVYAAGAGKDWALVNGSWDTMASLPTDSTVGALVTSATQMWSHPHASSVPDVTMCRDGGYLGSPFAVEFNGTSSRIDCGHDHTLDDLGAGGLTFQAECWFRLDTATAGTYVLLSKGWTALTGWALYINSSGYLTGVVDLVTTDSTPTLAVSVQDGKWHHGVLSYNDTTKAGYVCLDGVWGAVSTGNGNYQSDVGQSLYMGRRSDSAASYLLGALGWPRLHNNAHYTPLTGFIPPRVFPGADANTVECWAANEGTLAVLTPTVDVNNAGTLTNCTWSGVWAPVATPIVPTSLQCDGVATVINCGSDHTIDDIPSGGTITWDGWIRNAATTANARTIAEKGDAGANTGWVLYVSAADVLTMLVQLATTDATATLAMPRDNRCHHVVGYYDDTTRKCRVALDGLWGTLGAAGTGAYQSDAGSNLNMGRSTTGAVYWNGAFGWQRYSNNDRYSAATAPAGSAFCPPDRANLPAADGNTVEQWPFTDGAGLVALAVVDVNNNGVITMGAGKWLNTPDMAQDAPGERVFNWGYKFGSSAAGDGLTIRDIGVTASQDYVVRVVTHADPRSQPYLQFWDMIGGVQVGVNYYLPRRYGQHDGAANSPTLICSTGYFWQQLIGWRAYNITDGSATTLTAVSGDRTTCTGVLAGGTDNDWDVGDWYMLMPPVGKHESQYPYATETIHVIRTPVGCTSMECRINNNSTGEIGLHQFEVQPSLLSGGDHEAGAGNPFLLTAWATATLDAGDTEAEAAIVHAGVQSVQWNTGASVESMTYAMTIAANVYIGGGMWYYGDGTAYVRFGGNAAGNLPLQYTLAATYVVPPVTSIWKHSGGAWRVVLANTVFTMAAGAGAVAERYTDDIYAFALTPITLTVTPASAVNSAEADGIRVDGFDLLTNPAAVFQTASSIHIRARYIPRHEIALAAGFGDASEYLFDLREDANNYIRARREANVLRLSYNANGGGLVTAVGNIAGLWAANVENTVQVVMNPGAATLTFNGVAVVTLAGATFATAFTQPIRWGSSYVAENAFDGVIK
jgi:hypothetical protein